jgi:hypothetical protein
MRWAGLQGALQYAAGGGGMVAPQYGMGPPGIAPQELAGYAYPASLVPPGFGGPDPLLQPPLHPGGGPAMGGYMQGGGMGGGPLQDLPPGFDQPLWPREGRPHEGGEGDRYRPSRGAGGPMGGRASPNSRRGGRRGR